MPALSKQCPFRRDSPFTSSILEFMDYLKETNPNVANLPFFLVSKVIYQNHHVGVLISQLPIDSFQRENFSQRFDTKNLCVITQSPLNFLMPNCSSSFSSFLPRVYLAYFMKNTVMRDNDLPLFLSRFKLHILSSPRFFGYSVRRIQSVEENNLPMSYLLFNGIFPGDKLNATLMTLCFTQHIERMRNPTISMKQISTLFVVNENKVLPNSSEDTKHSECLVNNLNNPTSTRNFVKEIYPLPSLLGSLQSHPMCCFSSKDNASQEKLDQKKPCSSQPSSAKESSCQSKSRFNRDASHLLNTTIDFIEDRLCKLHQYYTTETQAKTFFSVSRDEARKKESQQPSRLPLPKKSVMSALSKNAQHLKGELFPAKPLIQRCTSSVDDKMLMHNNQRRQGRQVTRHRATHTGILEATKREKDPLSYNAASQKSCKTSTLMKSANEIKSYCRPTLASASRTAEQLKYFFALKSSSARRKNA